MHNKYFVTITKDDADTVLFHHISKYINCQFTSSYPPHEIFESFKTDDRLDEDKTVKKYMMEYKIDNVRGGSYSSIKLEDWQLKSLEHEFTLANINENVELMANYVKNFDTIEKINDEIEKVKSIHDKIAVLNKQITDTSIPTLDDIEGIRTYINQRQSSQVQMNVATRNLYTIITQYGEKIINIQKNSGRHNNEKIPFSCQNEQDFEQYDIVALQIIKFNLEKRQQLEELYAKFGNREHVRNQLIALYTKSINMLK